ncbi:MAG: ABC transporter permease subunit [Acidimicrobiia bacterium]
MTSGIVPLSWYRRVSIRSVFAKSLADRTTMTVLTGVGVGLMAFAVTAMFPSLEESLKELDLGSGFADFFGGASLATPAGWLSAEMWSIVAPFAIVALVLVDGARSVGSEEEERMIGMLAANPISRTRILAEKSGAVVVHMLVASALMGLLSWLAVIVIGLDLDANLIWGATLHLALLGFMAAATTVAVSALVGKRAKAMVVVGAIAAVAYISASMLPLFDQAAGWAELSPWYYYWGENPLIHGVNWGFIAIMGAIGTAVFGCAGLVFVRRDLPG